MVPAFRYLTASMAFVALVACHGAAKERYRRDLASTGAPALHAVHDAHLQMIMADLDALLFERQRTQSALDHERRRRTAEVAKVAAKMAEAARFLPASVVDLELDEGERRLFLSLAAKLETELMALESEARNNYVDALPTTRERIIATCDACHTAFRLPPTRISP